MKRHEKKFSGVEVKLSPSPSLSNYYLAEVVGDSQFLPVHENQCSGVTNCLRWSHQELPNLPQHARFQKQLSKHIQVFFKEKAFCCRELLRSVNSGPDLFSSSQTLCWEKEQSWSFASFCLRQVVSVVRRGLGNKKQLRNVPRTQTRLKPFIDCPSEAVLRGDNFFGK